MGLFSVLLPLLQLINNAFFFAFHRHNIVKWRNSGLTGRLLFWWWWWQIQTFKQLTVHITSFIFHFDVIFGLDSPNLIQMSLQCGCISFQKLSMPRWLKFPVPKHWYRTEWIWGSVRNVHFALSVVSGVQPWMSTITSCWFDSSYVKWLNANTTSDMSSSLLTKPKLLVSLTNSPAM